jgi:hypothetical protein
MDKSKCSKIGNCCWQMRHEVIGLTLLIIALYLTLATDNSFGIVALRGFALFV